MEIQLKVVISHPNDHFLHELQLCAWFTFFVLFEVHCDHEQVIRLQSRHLRLCRFDSAAQHVILRKAPHSILLPQRHQLTIALAIFLKLSLNRANLLN